MRMSWREGLGGLYISRLVCVLHLVNQEIRGQCEMGRSSQTCVENHNVPSARKLEDVIVYVTPDASSSR